MARALNRPTAKQARARGAEHYRSALSLQSNPYRTGYADRRPAKWFEEGWPAKARTPTQEGADDNAGARDTGRAG